MNDLEARLEVLPPLTDEGQEVDALHRELVQVSRSFLEMAGQQGQALMPLTTQIKEPIQLAYFAAPAVGLDIEKQQEILEADSRKEVLEVSLEALRYELEVMQLRKEISSNTKEKLDQEQREAILRRQLRSIREELGEDGGEAEEVEGFRERLKELQLPEKIHKELKKEIGAYRKIADAALAHVEGLGGAL